MRTTTYFIGSLMLASVLSACGDGASTNTSPNANAISTTAEVAKAKAPTELIAGKWKVDNYEISGEEKATEEDLKEIRSGSWWQFSDDGKVISHLLNEEFIKGTWTLSEDTKKVTIVSNENDEITYVIIDIEKLDDGNLVLNWKDEEGDMRWICKK